MIYKFVTKIWKISLIYGQTWLSAPLSRIINSFWIKNYRPILHNVKTSPKTKMVEFTFDLDKLGALTPALLYNVYWCIRASTQTSFIVGKIGIILTVNYDGDIKSLGGHYNVTDTSTPEDFINHFLHLTNKDGHGESKVVLAKAQILKAKVVKM